LAEQLEGHRQRQLISPEDGELIVEASCAEQAVAHISRFYRLFHSARPGADHTELLLNAPIPRELLPQLNHDFGVLQL
jgi:hypothetical protein